MFQKKYFKIEFLFFYLLLVFNLINIWSVDIYATLDGPSHLYNSGLLNYIDNSQFLNEYYVKNQFFLPNYLPHIILSKLFLLFDPFVSEKIFLSSIVVFLPLSFRYAVKLYSGTENNFAFLIFALVFTFLFHLGFFNFSFAFIFFNCQLILLWYFLNSKFNGLHIALFLISNLALFYTHPFVYGVSTATLFIILCLRYFSNFKELIKKSALLMAMCLPSIILFLLFLVKIKIPSAAEVNDVDYSFAEKLSGVIIFGPAISYIAGVELTYTSLFAYLFLFLLLFLFVKRIFFDKEVKGFALSDVFLFLSILILILIFSTHNGILGGMFTSRLTFLFFYFLTFWFCCNKIDSKIVFFISLIIVLFSYIKLSFIRHDVLLSLGSHARSINGASSSIKEKSVVYSVNYSDNWLEGHSSDYAGIGKEVVITGNYEAILGWFPLKWKWDKISRVKCEIDSVSGFILPDYVLFYGDPSRINLPENQNLKNFIETNTVKCYESPDKFCSLFKLNKKQKI